MNILKRDRRIVCATAFSAYQTAEMNNNLHKDATRCEECLGNGYILEVKDEPIIGDYLHDGTGWSTASRSSSVYHRCPSCGGSGYKRMVEIPESERTYDVCANNVSKHNSILEG